MLETLYIKCSIQISDYYENTFLPSTHSDLEKCRIVENVFTASKVLTLQIVIKR